MNIPMFSDHTGKTSSSRVLYAFCVVIFMSVWAWNSRDGMTPLDISQIALLAVVAGQKTGQSFAEHQKPKEGE